MPGIRNYFCSVQFMYNENALVKTCGFDIKAEKKTVVNKYLDSNKIFMNLN